MDDQLLLVLVIQIAFTIAIFRWAKKWGRNEWVYSAVSLIISPLLAAIFLFFHGKTDAIKDEEDFQKLKRQKDMEERLNKDTSNA